MEIYQPAYLFNSDGTLATRPTITSAPTGVSYGNSFTVQTPNASSIASVVFMRDGAVTHAFDMDQRQVGLSFTVGSGSLTVTAPPNSNIAPPGFYMLFLLNASGVPSVASIIQLSTGYATTGINFVQANTGPSTVQSSNASVSVNYVNPQTAGNLNIVAVGWTDTTSAISSVTDTGGNTYTRAVGPTASNGQQQSIYYAKNIAGGANTNTVTVTFNQVAAYPDVRILEYKGLDTTSPLDVTAAAGGSGTNASSGSATTTSANELIFGAGTTAGVFSAPGSGFTTRMINIFGNIAEDEVVSSTGSYAATATNSAGNWLMQMATFKASGASGDFSITASPSGATVNTGSSVNYTVTVSPLNGFSSAITLACSGLPSGASCTFNPASVTPNSNPATSTLTISTASGTIANTYNVTITGTSGSLSHNKSVSLTVQTTSSTANFSISATSPVTVSAGASIASAVSIDPVDGFNSAVNLTCTSGLPSGATCSFSPTSLPGSGSSTLSITTASATPVGSYPITVTGTSESLTHPVTVTLRVAAGGSFSLSTPSPASATVTAGSSATFTTSITPSGSFAGTVSLSCAVATSASPAPACSSSQVTVNGAAAQATLSVTTTAPHVSLVSWRKMFYAMFLPLGGIMLLGASGGSRRKKVLGLLLMLLVSGLLFLTACGGGGSSSSNSGGGTTGGTPAGTYTVTVTGTSGSVGPHTATFTLTVQ